MVLKPVDTAIIMIVGPLIDSTDFKTLEEAIAYNAAGMDISLIIEKTDGTSTTTTITLTTGGTSDWTHKDGGYYEVEITAAQNAEEGIAYVRGVCTGVLPFESPRYEIVKANIYDSLVKGTDTLDTTNPDIIIPIPNIPNAINLSDSATVRIGIGITNAIGNLPTTTEITPGTIHIYRKAIGGTSWVGIVNGATCSESNGLIYYDEVFDTISGYAAGNSIKIIFAGQKVTVNSIDHDITIDGWTFYTYIREEMRGTDSAALATALTTVDTVVDGIQTDLSNAADGLGALKAGIDAIPTTAMRGTDNAALAATALADTTWTDAKAGFLNHSLSTIDTVVDGIQTDLSNAADGLGALKAGIDAIPTTAMRGTNSVPTNPLLTNDARLNNIDTTISSRNATTPPTVAEIKTKVEEAGSSLATILTDTNELQTDLVNGGRLDVLIDSIIVDVTAIDVLTEAGGSGDLTSIKTQVDAILSLERESGTPTVTGAETTLYEDAAPTKNKMGVVVKIDMAALQAGDTFVVKEKYKDESGGVYQEIDSVEYTGAQTKPLRIIALTPYRYGAIITMQKTAGTDRCIEWESFVGE